MKIYTKTGDQGETSLFGGNRVKKNHIRVEAYGSVDELNAWIGLLADLGSNVNVLRTIQDRLFTLGSILATEKESMMSKLPILRNEDVVFLEKEIDAMSEVLPPMTHFILPGGHVYVSYAHIARTVCRRAERAVISLADLHSLDQTIITYLNRLSDFLFILSRKLSQELGAEEIKWIPKK